mmetsp:Transcript_13438/g.35855  ORF Transcript_13438/g.35855 Transcript_13438/m.35855 type:complete len:100 (+) Transcript_13438:461-760(+)
MLRVRDSKFAAATSVAEEKIASAEFMFSELTDTGRCSRRPPFSLAPARSLIEKNRLRMVATNADNVDVVEDITSIVKSARLTQAEGRAAANRTAWSPSD